MKANVPVMSPNTEFSQWNNRFPSFMMLKVADPIPQLAMRDFGVYLDESAHNSYAFALLLHVAGGNKRADQEVRCFTATRPDCCVVAWQIVYESPDAWSFARTLALLDSLMLRQRPGQSVTEYVHFMRPTFDDCNKTCQMVDD
jgi:hypothetical protein